MGFQPEQFAAVDHLRTVELGIHLVGQVIPDFADELDVVEFVVRYEAQRVTGGSTGAEGGERAIVEKGVRAAAFYEVGPQNVLQDFRYPVDTSTLPRSLSFDSRSRNGMKSFKCGFLALKSSSDVTMIPPLTCDHDPDRLPMLDYPGSVLMCPLRLLLFHSECEQYAHLQKGTALSVIVMFC